jgi:hypothetical protein
LENPFKMLYEFQQLESPIIEVRTQAITKDALPGGSFDFVHA